MVESPESKFRRQQLVVKGPHHWDPEKREYVADAPIVSQPKKTGLDAILAGPHRYVPGENGEPGHYEALPASPGAPPLPPAPKSQATRIEVDDPTPEPRKRGRPRKNPVEEIVRGAHSYDKESGSYQKA